MTVTINGVKDQGNVDATLIGSTIQMPVDLQDHNILDANPIPTKLQSHSITTATAIPIKNNIYEKRVTLANAVEIRNTATTYIYNLITHGGLTEEEIRQYKRIKISLYDTHSNGAATATGTVTIGTAQPAQGALTTLQSSGQIYHEIGVIPNGAAAFVFSSRAVGTGGSASHKTIAALDDVHSNLLIRIWFNVAAPDAGSITIVAELQG